MAQMVEILNGECIAHGKTATANYRMTCFENFEDAEIIIGGRVVGKATIQIFKSMEQDIVDKPKGGCSGCGGAKMPETIRELNDVLLEGL